MAFLVTMCPIVGPLAQIYKESKPRSVLDRIEKGQITKDVENLRLSRVQRLINIENKAFIPTLFQVVVGFLVAALLSWNVAGIAVLSSALGHSAVNIVLLSQNRKNHLRLSCIQEIEAVVKPSYLGLNAVDDAGWGSLVRFVTEGPDQKKALVEMRRRIKELQNSENIKSWFNNHPLTEFENFSPKLDGMETGINDIEERIEAVQGSPVIDTAEEKEEYLQNQDNLKKAVAAFKECEAKNGGFEALCRTILDKLANKHSPANPASSQA